MTKTIAVIGVGPGVGMAVARRFGKEGHQVALLARSEDALAGFVAELTSMGVTAAAFPADVTDRPGLARALARAEETFGSIDVIEYSPAPGSDSVRIPRDTTPELAQFHIDLELLGAVAAVQQVLPGMLARGDGALLFCAAATAKSPITLSANYSMAAAGLRSYTYTLNADLAKDGIYAGMVEIGGTVDRGIDDPHRAEAPMPTPDALIVKATTVADAFWDMYMKRDQLELLLGDIELVHQLVAQLAAGGSS
jgi:NAD(P)-dependent dehydrogenase (short-subunit alcohol dehydrogenase family)